MTFDEMKKRAFETATNQNSTLAMAAVLRLVAFLFFIPGCFVFITSIPSMIGWGCFFISLILWLCAGAVQKGAPNTRPPSFSLDDVFIWFWTLEIDKIQELKSDELHKLASSEVEKVKSAENFVVLLKNQHQDIHDLPESKARDEALQRSAVILENAEECLTHARNVLARTNANTESLIAKCEQWRAVLNSQKPVLKVIADAKNINLEALEKEVAEKLVEMTIFWHNETGNNKDAEVVTIAH